MHNNFIGCPYIHQLTLNGKGKMSTNSDIAIVNISVITEDKELDKSKKCRFAGSYSEGCRLYELCFKRCTA